MKKKGYKTVMVGGGARVNKSALRQGIIDEILVDVEPFVIGKGVPLFSPINKNLRLILLSTRKIGKNTIQIHYKVLKQ